MNLIWENTYSKLKEELGRNPSSLEVQERVMSECFGEQEDETETTNNFTNLS